ncbi:MAG: hypothetical protein HRT71_04710 [Flavobacteriales bacterium]|nr:hypothetical protein [Flavobacteriales bacterium]
MKIEKAKNSARLITGRVGYDIYRDHYLMEVSFETRPKAFAMVKVHDKSLESKSAA